MKKPISLVGAAVAGGSLVPVADTDAGAGACATPRAVRLTAGRDETVLTLAGLDGAFFAGMRYFCVALTSRAPFAEALFLRMAEADGREMTMQIMLFPGVRAVAAFRLDLMDGSLMFPPLLPGTLKCCVHGGGVRVADVTRVELGLLHGQGDARAIDIEDVWASDEPPAFPPQDHTTVDVLGQWKQREWQGKTPSLAAMRAELTAEERAAEPPMSGRSRFGGCLAKRFEPTGFFRTVRDGGRWYLADPDGCAFFSSGVFGVYPGEPGWILGVEDAFDDLPDPRGRFAPAFDRAGDLELYRRKFSGMFPDDTRLYAPATANLIGALGEDWYDRWAKLTARRLRALGVNTLSMFSDPKFVKSSGMPYVIMLKGFPVTKRTLFREFPDVFSDEYDALSRAFAAQLAPYADDPLLIGYFLNNEPTWGFVSGVSLAERLLENGRGTASMRALIAFLRARYAGDIGALNAAWRAALPDFDALEGGMTRASERSDAARDDLRAFTDILVDRYAEIPARYARAAAPRHLNLGMRFASVNNDALFRTARYFDVFSLNCYAAYPTDALRALEARLDMPMLVGEFHFGALDAGLPHPSLFQVRDQAARGKAYARYLTRAAAEPCGVGAHYFAYNDQPLWGRYDGENYQFGFVDICNRPYAAFTAGVRGANARVYDVMQGIAPPEGGETERL